MCSNASVAVFKDASSLEVRIALAAAILASQASRSLPSAASTNASGMKTRQEGEERVTTNSGHSKYSMPVGQHTVELSVEIPAHNIDILHVQLMYVLRDRLASINILQIQQYPGVQRIWIKR